MKDKASKNRILSVMITALFLAFIIAGCILYIFLPKKNYSETEKRYLAGAPEISVENIKTGKFSEEFENYLSDHTPLRTFFVSVSSYFELIKGNNGSNGVYLGKNGMLIEKPFETENRFDKNTDEIITFCKNIDLPVTLIAVPEKGAVCEKYLPKNALRYYDFDYLKALSEKCNGINNLSFIDLTDSFKAENADTYYYKTDHHWTSDGAFEAYKLICSAKEFESPLTDNYHIRSYDGFYGTSYSKSCFTLTKPDEVKLYINKASGGKADIIITEGKEIKEYGSMFFTERLDEGDKYTVFLDGNHTKVDIKSGVNNKKLLVIKDSFAHCLVPFLAEQYGEIVMIDQRYFTKPVNKLIEEENYDEVMLIYGVDSLATSRDITLK